MTTLTTDVILRQLNAEYQYSKAEQIRRFLLDQDNLKRTLSVYGPSSCGGVVVGVDSSDDETESTDSGATEMAFEERMSVYKVRPQSAYPGTSRVSLSDEDAEVDSPDKTAGRRTHGHQRRQQTTHAAHDNTQQDYAPPTRQRATDRRVAYGEGQRLLRRRVARPRTATGVRTAGGRTESGPLRDLRIEGIAPRGAPAEETKPERKQRSSAPATLSRSRHVPRDFDETERRGLWDTNPVSGLELPSCVPDGVTTVDSTEHLRLTCHTSRWSKSTAVPETSRESDLLVVGSATARPVDRDWHPVTSRKPSRQLHRLHVPDCVTSCGFDAPSRGKLAVLKLPPLETVGVTPMTSRQATVVQSGGRAGVPTPHQFLAG